MSLVSKEKKNRTLNTSRQAKRGEENSIGRKKVTVGSRKSRGRKKQYTELEEKKMMLEIEKHFN